MAKGNGGSASSGRGTRPASGGGYTADSASFAISPAQASAVLGKDLSLDQLGRLAGAPPGSKILVEKGTNGRGEGITLKAFGKDVGNMTRYIYKDGQGRLVIFNNQIQKPTGAPAGYAKRSLDLQKAAARKAGIKRIEAFATGGRGQVHNGYYTLPRLGYNGNLKPQWLAKAPPHLRSAKTVQALFRRRGGREWWKENGQSFPAHINL